jgi:hypothetical protein
MVCCRPTTPKLARHDCWFVICCSKQVLTAATTAVVIPYAGCFLGGTMCDRKWSMCQIRAHPDCMWKQVLPFWRHWALGRYVPSADGRDCDCCSALYLRHTNVPAFPATGKAQALGDLFELDTSNSEEYRWHQISTAKPGPLPRARHCAIAVRCSSQTIQSTPRFNQSAHHVAYASS